MGQMCRLSWGAAVTDGAGMARLRRGAYVGWHRTAGIGLLQIGRQRRPQHAGAILRTPATSAPSLGVCAGTGAAGPTFVCGGVGGIVVICISEGVVAARVLRGGEGSTLRAVAREGVQVWWRGGHSRWDSSAPWFTAFATLMPNVCLGGSASAMKLANANASAQRNQHGSTVSTHPSVKSLSYVFLSWCPRLFAALFAALSWSMISYVSCSQHSTTRWRSRSRHNRKAGMRGCLCAAAFHWHTTKELRGTASCHHTATATAKHQGTFAVLVPCHQSVTGHRVYICMEILPRLVSQSRCRARPGLWVGLPLT